MLCRGQPDSGETSVVLENGPTCSRIANHPKRRHLQYANFVLQVKNAANKAKDRYVWNLDAGCRGTSSTSEWSQLLCELSDLLSIHHTKI